jgi:hypothetical protein
MANDVDSCPKFAWLVLFFIGIFDLIRGLMHTIFIDWAIATFAHLDLSCAPDDQKMLLMAFGISNYLTGAIFILVSIRARQIVAPILLLVPLSYFLGALIIKATLHPQSDFLGQWFMMVYLLACGITFVAIYVQKWLTKKNAPKKL